MDREAIGSIPDLTLSQRQEVDLEITAAYTTRPGRLYFDAMSSLDSPALQDVRELNISNSNSIGALRSSHYPPDS